MASVQRRMVVTVVAIVAVLVRLVPVLRGGGLLFWGRYDDGVYYTASASLLDGRVPYRDFVLLHPPLIAVVLLPFTLLGRLTTDPTGLATARLTWMLLSVVTAVLAARLAGRWGTWPGLAAGLWCACSAGASYAGQTTFIEPAGDLALFGAVLLLTCDSERPRHELVAGALLGVALTAKIWYVAPVTAIVIVLLVDRRLRSAARAAGAAVAVACAILLPFLALAPRQMWQMVVFDQLSRPHGRRTDPLDRLGLAVAGRGLGLSTTWQAVVTLLMAAAFAVAVVVCLRDRQARLVGAVAMTCVGVLMASPVVFHHYGAFPAAPVGATLAIGWSILGAALLRRLRLRRLAVPLGVAAALVLLAGGGAVAARPLDRTFPTTAVEAALPPGCITADDPTTLILVDRLSSDLRAGCDVAVDVTGASYGVRVGRGKNLAYQDWLRAYLRSGTAAIVARRAHDGIPRQALTPLGSVVYTNRWVHVVRP
jgi:alpha-1,2-mannosyltransferase